MAESREDRRLPERDGPLVVEKARALRERGVSSRCGRCSHQREGPRWGAERVCGRPVGAVDDRAPPYLYRPVRLWSTLEDIPPYPRSTIGCAPSFHRIDPMESLPEVMGSKGGSRPSSGLVPGFWGLSAGRRFSGFIPKSSSARKRWMDDTSLNAPSGISIRDACFYHGNHLRGDP